MKKLIKIIYFLIIIYLIIMGAHYAREYMRDMHNPLIHKTGNLQ